MARGTGIRPWVRGTAAQRAASTVIPLSGELGVDDSGNIVATDGLTSWQNLKRLVRLDEVTSAVQQYVTTTIVTNSNLSALGAETGWQWALIDSSGKIALGVAPDGSVSAGKLNLTAGTVPLQALASGVQAGIMQTLPPETGVLWALVDPQGRVPLSVTADGTVSMPKFAPADGSITLAKLATTIQQSLPAAAGVEGGYAYAITDSAGQVGFGVKTSGELYGKGIHPHAVATNDAYIVETYLDSFGQRQLRSTNRSTGTTVALTGSGSNNVAPSLTSDSQVQFLTDRNGSGWERWVVPAAGGDLYPLMSVTTPIYTPGDSLTAGTNSNDGGYPEWLARITGKRVVNDGVGGQTSTAIAARQGGAPAKVTFPSDSIPATTSAITCTVDVSLLTGAIGAFSRYGTIAGVHGLLTGNASVTAYTFTRDTAGSAVSTAAGGSPFIPDTLPTYKGSMLGVFVGRNDFKDVPAATIVANAQAMVAAMKALQKRFWVLSIPPWEGEENGTGTRTTLNNVNTALAAAFPNNFIDTAAGLRNTAFMTQIGLTPTANDLTDIANGITPRQLRINTVTATQDAGHLNEYGYRIVAIQVANWITTKGWLI